MSNWKTFRRANHAQAASGVSRLGFPVGGSPSPKSGGSFGRGPLRPPGPMPDGGVPVSEARESWLHIISLAISAEETFSYRSAVELSITAITERRPEVYVCEGEGESSGLRARTSSHAGLDCGQHCAGQSCRLESAIRPAIPL